MEEDAPKPVLSEEQLHTLFKTETNWIDYARAIERAVLEAVGGQYDALNRGIIADLAPVNSQPHSYARGAVLEAVDTITALRAFHSRAIGILGAHGALDQGVEVDALTWLADVLTQADQLRAELEQQLHRFQHGEAIESDYICSVGQQMLAVIEERDAAQRELAEAREEIGRCNEREAAMEAEAGAWKRDHDRVEYLEALDGEVSLIRWTGRRRGEIKGLGWVLVHDGPGVVSSDVSPTVRAALDRARGVA